MKSNRRLLRRPVDAGVLYVVLGTVAANMLDGDPVWLLLVAASGGGKTEFLNALLRLEGVHTAAVLTEAALLSGTSKRETANDARGGLLRVIGSRGILLHKDFGSVLSMNRDQRAALLGALREIFDGSWTRHVGTDGGRTLHWEGKLALIAGCTPVIDQHHAVTSQLGERFVMYRAALTDPAQQAIRSLANISTVGRVRSELRTAVQGLFAGVELDHVPEFSPIDVDRLVALASLVVRCRSAVVRDPHSREIEFVPDAEAPGRLVTVLGRLLTGLRLIGLDDIEAWRVTRKAGLDSMPAIRRQILELLLVAHEAADEPYTTAAIGEACGLPTQTARRALQDLTAHGVTQRVPAPKKGAADRWTIAEWSRVDYHRVSVPEMSGDQDRVSLLKPRPHDE